MFGAHLLYIHFVVQKTSRNYVDEVEDYTSEGKLLRICSGVVVFRRKGVPATSKFIASVHGASL